MSVQKSSYTYNLPGAATCTGAEVFFKGKKKKKKKKCCEKIHRKGKACKSCPINWA